MSYFGRGDKALIMKNIHDIIEAIPNLANKVDYQRDYAATTITPEKYPGCFVNDIVEDKEQVLGDIFRNTLSVGIVGWLRVEDGENLWAKQNTMAKSILDALMVDVTRGSQAYSTTPTRLTTDFGSRHPIGLFVIVLTIVFYASV